MAVAMAIKTRSFFLKQKVFWRAQKSFWRAQILLREILPVPVDATWDEFHWRERRRWETDGQYDRIDKRYWGFEITGSTLPNFDPLNKVFVRNDILWRRSCSASAVHLVPCLSHHQLSAGHKGSCQVKLIPGPFLIEAAWLSLVNFTKVKSCLITRKSPGKSMWTANWTSMLQQNSFQRWRWSQLQDQC